MSAAVEVVAPPGLEHVRDSVTALVAAVLDAEASPGPVIVAFVDEPAIRRLNRRYRDLDEPTDVLSFRYADAADWQEGEELGEVAVCPAVVVRYADQDEDDRDRRLAWTIVHGVLHLLGYDHETDGGEMRLREQRLLRGLESLVQAPRLEARD